MNALFNLAQTAKITNGELCAPPETEFYSVSIDSREEQSKKLFCAIRGGHDYIQEAVNKGAVAVLSEKPVKVAHILVKNTTKALANLAKAKRALCSGKVIGITGSVGKTSVKDMCAAVFFSAFLVGATKGNFNNQIGLPLSILQEGFPEIYALEMGMSHAGEISELSAIARPNICIITNIGEAHIENFPNGKLGILNSKLEIFDGAENATAIINANDSLLRSADYSKIAKRVVFCGSKKNISKTKNEFFAFSKKILKKNEGFSFLLNWKLPNRSGESEFSVNGAGEHAAENATLAIVAGLLCGMSSESISRGLDKYKIAQGRGKVIKTSYITIIDDSYNASPDSMRAALDVLAQENARRVAILGDMLELGERANDLHKEIGAYANVKVDFLLALGKNANDIILEFKGSSSVYSSLEELIKDLPKVIKKGDAVLVKASRGMRFEKIIQELKKF